MSEWRQYNLEVVCLDGGLYVRLFGSFGPCLANFLTGTPHKYFTKIWRIKHDVRVLARTEPITAVVAREAVDAFTYAHSGHHGRHIAVRAHTVRRLRAQAPQS